MSEAEKPEDFEARRAHGKAVADQLRADSEKAGKPLGWFDAVYRGADGDPAMVPWGHQRVRPELAGWLAALPVDFGRGRALDVGAGLGDNANALADAGFHVTAFDISGEAIEWAAKRFPQQSIEWGVHNLMDPAPDDWRDAFDLVCEVYTLQALRQSMRADAICNLAEFVKRGGHLLVITKASDSPPEGETPPWPLQRRELDVLAEVLEEVRFECLEDESGGSPHFRALYRKPESD